MLHLILEQSSTWQRNHNLLLDKLLSQPTCPHVPPLKRFCNMQMLLWSPGLVKYWSGGWKFPNHGITVAETLVLSPSLCLSWKLTTCGLWGRPNVLELFSAPCLCWKQFPDSYQQSLYLVQHAKVDWNGCLSSRAAWGVSKQWLLKSLNLRPACSVVILMGLVLSCDHGCFQLFYSCLENCFSSQSSLQWT